MQPTMRRQRKLSKGARAKAMMGRAVLGLGEGGAGESMLPDAVVVRMGEPGARGRRAGARAQGAARVAWGLLAALASSAPDAEGRRKLQFGPAGIIIPAVYPA